MFKFSICIELNIRGQFNDRFLLVSLISGYTTTQCHRGTHDFCVLHGTKPTKTPMSSVFFFCPSNWAEVVVPSLGSLYHLALTQSNPFKNCSAMRGIDCHMRKKKYFQSAHIQITRFGMGLCCNIQITETMCHCFHSRTAISKSQNKNMTRFRDRLLEPREKQIRFYERGSTHCTHTEQTRIISGVSHLSLIGVRRRHQYTR